MIFLGWTCDNGQNSYVRPPHKPLTTPSVVASGSGTLLSFWGLFWFKYQDLRAQSKGTYVQRISCGKISSEGPYLLVQQMVGT